MRFSCVMTSSGCRSSACRVASTDFCKSPMERVGEPQVDPVIQIFRVGPGRQFQRLDDLRQIALNFEVVMSVDVELLALADVG